MADTLIMMHGYDPEGMDGGRAPEDVWQDRLEKTYELAETRTAMGLDVAVGISGGGDYDGRTEAEIVRDYAEEELPELTDDYTLHLEEASTDTQEFVENIYDIAKEEGAGEVTTVTSKDHAPRVQRNLSNATEDIDDVVFTVAASEEHYSENGKDPYIVEGAFSGDLIDAFNQVWGVPGDALSDAAEDVKDVFERYT
ncbi:MAG: ElyC/SanA/YdcF family protein [Candidatus Nanohaloarchaea archaeon]|nr:ElyC/SanA/YdcF family protein [Candidatus Nanohaloarchaea archaeon]